MEIDEFIETDTGKKTIKEIESLKKELYDNWGYSTEELHHIELCMLKLTTEIYMMAEDWEENATNYAKTADKYRKILLSVADAVGASSPVVDSTSVMEEAMFYSLPQEIRKIKDNEFYSH
jgi:hypothetical protein